MGGDTPGLVVLGFIIIKQAEQAMRVKPVRSCDGLNKNASIGL